MYDININLENYFNELDPKLRLEILDSLKDSGNEDFNFLREIYNKRYPDENNDKWLWRCMCLLILFGRGKIFKRSRDREVLKIVNELSMNDSDTSHRNLLYHEYRNAAKRYLSTCKSSGYASGLLGLRKAEDDEKIYRACQDIWQMSKGIAKSSGLLNEMNLWCEAFRDELFSYSPLCQEAYGRLDI